MENSVEFLRKLKIGLLYNPAISNKTYSLRKVLKAVNLIPLTHFQEAEVSSWPWYSGPHVRHTHSGCHIHSCVPADALRQQDLTGVPDEETGLKTSEYICPTNQDNKRNRIIQAETLISISLKRTYKWPLGT